MRRAGVVLAATVAVAGGGILALHEFPPPLLRTGSNYAAEIVCSEFYLAGRDPREVLRTDVQAPGSAFLRLMRVTLDRRDHLVRAGIAGFIGNGLAVEIPGRGCTVIPDGRWRSFLARSRPPTHATAATAASTDPGAEVDSAAAPNGDPLWPDGDRAAIVPRLQSIVDEASLAGLVGVLVGEGRLSLDASAGLGRFPGDPRAAIRIADLMSMTDGLRFNERYSGVSDVTRMLFLEPDMAAYAASRPPAIGRVTRNSCARTASGTGPACCPPGSSRR
jgi:hypothetical protein